MTKIIFDSFRNTLKEVQLLYNIIEQKRNNKSKLIEGLNQAHNLLFSSYSSLSIFSEVIQNEVSIGYKLSFDEEKHKKKLSKIEAKVIYNKLLKILNSEIDKGVLKPKESLILENQINALGLHLFSASIDEDFQKFNDNFTTDALPINKLSSLLKKYFEVIIKYIEDILLYDVFLIFEVPDITYTQELVNTRDYRKEYIEKWLDCSVTLSDVNLYKRRDYWEEIHKLDLEFEKLDKIEIHQKKLFDKQLENLVRCQIEDIGNSELIINNHIEFIECFLKNDISRVLIKRLNELIKFTNPEEVLVQYDKILIDGIYIADYIIYYQKSSAYSSIFVASFFIKYLNELKELIAKVKGDFQVKENDYHTFTSLFSDRMQKYILQLLEDLSITQNGTCILTPRKKGALRGVVEALREKRIIPNIGLATLCNVIAKKINLELKSELDASNLSESYLSDALEYIKKNPLH